MLRPLCRPILLHLATSRTDQTIQFVTGYPFLFSLLHFLFTFHNYLQNSVIYNLKKKKHGREN